MRPSGVLAWLMGGLLRRLHPVLRVVARAEELEGQGRRAEAITLLENHVGLTSKDYNDPKQLTLRLRGLGEGNFKALFVLALATLLAVNGRQQDCFALYVCDAGIEASDYSDPPRLLAKLQRRGKSLTPIIAFQYLILFIAALGHVNLYGEGLLLLQLDAGLQETDYNDKEVLVEKIRRRVSWDEGLLPDLQQMYVMMLATSLSVGGRQTEAIAVLEAWFGLSSYDDIDRLRRELRIFQSRLQPASAIAAVVTLCMYLSDTDRTLKALALLEADLGLDHGDYQARGRLAEALGSRFKGLAPEVSIMYVLMLVSGLEQQGRPGDALNLLGTWVGLTLEEVGGWPAVAQKLRSGMENVNRSVAVTYLNVLAGVLSSGERAMEALALMEAYAGLEPSSYSDSEALASQLKAALEGCSEGTMGVFILTLCMLQEELPDVNQRVAALVDAYVSRLVPLAEPARQDPVSYQGIGIYALWFQLCSPQAGRRGIEVAERLVPNLRFSLSFRGVNLQDRSRYLEYAMMLRRGLLETAYREAEQEGDTAETRGLWLKAQFWDAELSQRLLLERFRLEEIQSLPGAGPLLPGWPFLETPRPFGEGHLPEPSAALGLGVLSVDAAAPAISSNEAAVDPPLKVAYPELFDQIEEILRQGIDEEILAITLGESGVLVRATFGSDGRLIWSALKSDGYRLKVGPWGRGRTGDNWRLRWATTRHDFRIAMARFDASARGVIRALVRRDLRVALEKLLPVLKESGTVMTDLASRLEEVKNALASSRQVSLRMLGPVTEGLDHPPGDTGERGAWLVEAREALAGCLAFVDARTPQAGLRSTLESATRDYLKEVGAIWRLAGLSDLLAPEVDVVFQVEDALHAVPLAYLEVDDSPLFSRVRSVRSSLSVLLSLFQKEAEDDFGGQGSGEEALLCVSHFTRDDLVWPASVWLHHGQINLADEHGLTCYSAAESPAGTAAAVRAVLSRRGAFRTVTLCGHGNHATPGVLLGDGLWQGGGSDLSRVGWLLLVSCSVGRLAQTGDRDVEGLCVQLALHRALSVLACTWPVAAVEAVAFANEAVRQYLTLLTDPGANPENLRARAVNLARKALLDGEGGEQALIGLNTAAAFELYGLG